MFFSSQTVSDSNSFDTPPNRQTPPNIEIVPSNVVLSLAVAPLLVGLWGAKTLTTLMRDIGEASEEVFRGSRLPVLNFPTTASTDSPENDIRR